MAKLKKNIKAKAQSLVAGTSVKLPKKISNTKSNTLLNKTITPKKNTTKKEKFRQKHKELMNKFALLKKKRKEENARKHREKAAVVGDLKPLKDALPSLDELFKLSKSKDNIRTGLKEYDAEQGGQKLSAKQKIKQKRNKLISQVNSYQALLKDKDFKKDPRAAIAFHIKYNYGINDE